MARRHRITGSVPTLAVYALGAVVALATLGACGSNKKEVESARHSLYDTDFAVVYTAALEATRDLYPNLDDNPGPGKIATSWHQVQYANCEGAGSTCDDSVQQRTLASQGPMSPTSSNLSGGGNGVAPTSSMAGMPTRLAYKRYFIRFDVHVVGGRPWRVKVNGHAASWDPGAAMPTELKGADKPSWLEGRTQSLQVAIYKKVKQYAVPMKEDVGPSEADEGPKTDPSSFKDVPAAAAKQLATIKDVLAKRDYTALRPTLADDVVWSLGGGAGADAAMAMWQADPTYFEAMTGTLATCVAASDKRVTCPGGTPAVGAYQLTLEARGDAWKVTSFVRAE
jgi:hypothetical protein